MENILRLNTITDIHSALGYEKPKHPLITLIDLSKVKVDKQYEGTRIVMGFYSIYMKNKCPGDFRYGRSYIDFGDGTLSFMAPEQSYMIENIRDDEDDMKGWALYFHPDLIRRGSLGDKIHDYSFFSYSANEALHLSDSEKQTIERIMLDIREEYSMNIDEFSHDLINSSIELLLNYGKRFYGRQFITRQNSSKDMIVQFEEFLYKRINSEDLQMEGLPTVKECAEKMCLSPNYLSDMLRKETGKNTKEYIHYYLIERAKNMLLNTSESVNEIAYELGFEYPEYFSKLFKKKTGMSPSSYREDVEKSIEIN